MKRTPSKRKALRPALSRGESYTSLELCKYLGQKLPGFLRLPEKQRRGVAWMLANFNAKNRAHSLEDGAARFHHLHDLEPWFGRGGFNQVAHGLGLFHVLPDWRKGVHTRPIYLSEPALALLDGFYRKVAKWGDSHRDQLLDPLGSKLRTLPSALASKNSSDGQTRAGFKGVELPPAVPVDMSGLLLLSEVLGLYIEAKARPQAGLFGDAVSLRDLEDTKRTALQFFHKAKADPAPVGCVPTRYVECSTGRLYASGTSLQTCARIIRQTAMRGLWDVDIKNCHYSMLHQMAAREGYQARHIEHYLRNRKEVRRDIAAALDVPIGTAKDLLISLIYGARFSVADGAAMVELLGRDKAATAPKIELLANLKQDIAAARKAVLGSAKVSRGKVMNLRGLACDEDGRPESVLAHILQGAEAVALEAAVTPFLADVVLLQHDGFSSRRKFTRSELDQMEAAMEAATGLRLEVEQEQICPDLEEFLADRDSLEDEPEGTPEPHQKRLGGRSPARSETAPATRIKPKRRA